MSYFKWLVVIIVPILMLIGCTHLKPTKLTDAKGSCYSYTGPDDDAYCGVDQRRVCDRFLNGLDQMPDFEGCIAHCEQVNKDVMLDPAIQGCNALRIRAEWLCRDYCYDNYKK